MESLIKIAKFTKQSEYNDTWEWLITARTVVMNAYAAKLETTPKYLTQNANFIDAVMLNNKHLAIASLNKAIEECIIFRSMP